MLLRTRVPAPVAAPATAPRPPDRDGDGCVAPQCAPSLARQQITRPSNRRGTSGEPLTSTEREPIAAGRSRPYAFDMAAQAGLARTDGGPEPTEHAPSSFGSGRGSRCSDCRWCTSFAASTRRAGGGRRRSASSRSARSPSACWRSVRWRSARSAWVRRRSGSAGDRPARVRPARRRSGGAPASLGAPDSSRSRRTRSAW